MAEDNNFQHLDDGEQRLAERHSVPRAFLIHEIIRGEGEEELEREAGALALSGLAAGLSMGFSFLTEALLIAGLPDTVWRHTLASFGYAVGFIIVVLARQQLFTESTLTALLPLITRRDRKTLLGTLRLWAVVLTANIAGTWIFAALVHAPGLFPPDVTPALRELAAQAIPHRLRQHLCARLLRGLADCADGVDIAQRLQLPAFHRAADHLCGGAGAALAYHRRLRGSGLWRALRCRHAL